MARKGSPTSPSELRPSKLCAANATLLWTSGLQVQRAIIPVPAHMLGPDDSLPKTATPLSQDATGASIAPRAFGARSRRSPACDGNGRRTRSRSRAATPLPRSGRPKNWAYRLLERARAADERTRGLDPRAHLLARQRCPLLAADGTCSVHAKRPLGCRGWNSRSAELCRESVETGNDDINITAVGEIVLISGAVRSGVEAGLEQHQLFSDLVELTAALVIALEHPDAAERYLAGEPLFEPARVMWEQSPTASSGPRLA